MRCRRCGAQNICLAAIRSGLTLGLLTTAEVRLKSRLIDTFFYSNGLIFSHSISGGAEIHMASNAVRY